jgi:hypothetical protein
VSAKKVAVPAQGRVRLDDAQRLPPAAEAGGQQHQQRAIGRGAARPFAAALRDSTLVAEEGILGHQRRPTPRQIGADTG